MSEGLLRTKLFVPRIRPSLVSRPRLLQKLNQGISHGSKLTLISAPAGFGKTTMVSEWLVNLERPSAWFSLDEGDADLKRFLTYFTAALQMIVDHVGQGVLAALQSSQLPPMESVLTALLNDISAVSEPFIFVLDDYHVVDARPVDEALAFLLEHMPPQMHLVITTREDPNLPLARLRGRNQLTELRAVDLRFSLTEATEFLRQVMGLNLTEENIATLEARTEGWIAGLQLAALSMFGREDAAGFIRAFTGDNRFILDYLVEEVLRQQPERTRNFLLQTAILDRLNYSLCEAVTGQQEAKAHLETLERGNFFLIPLDDKRHWYRYHHLFAEVLHVHLTAEHPELAPTLHRRASDWFERNGSKADAIRHALAAEDFERAAILIERSFTEMGRTRQESVLLGWFQALPDDLFQHRPVLSVHYAGALLQNGHLEGVEPMLRNAEQWLDTPSDIGKRPIFADEEDLKRLPGLVGMYRAGIALMQSDVASTIQYARHVLEIAPQDEYFQRGAASSLLGLAYWTNGDLQTAYQMFANGMAYLERVGFISDVVGGSVTLADIRIIQGRLGEAMNIYKHGLQLATKQSEPVLQGGSELLGGPALRIGPALRGGADMYVGMSELYREYNDLNAAEQHLLASEELGELNGLSKNPYRRRVAMARIREAQGDLDGALDLLEEAAPLYVGDFSPNFRPVQALRARLWIVQGRLDQASIWAREQRLAADDELSYVREFEHITLARLLLARYVDGRSDSSIGDTLDLLGRLLQAAGDGGRMGNVIEIRLLQALALQALGDLPAALISLRHALELAEPEGYVRIFLEAGSGMGTLLREAAANGIMADYCARLLEAFGAEEQGNTAHEAKPISLKAPALVEPLVEPLSQRELDILRLFKTELSGPEIADELVIALSTVRTHTKGIYSKLNVNSRRAAVIRGEELGLI